MSFSNYTNLQSEILNWFDVSSGAITTADIVTLAEASIKNVRISEMVKRATAPTSTTSRYLETPTGFVSMISLHLDGSPIKPLSQVSTEQINTHSRTAAAKPQFFSIVGDQIEFDCIPDAVYTAEMKYYEFLALSGSNATNVVLTNYPDLYLAECRKHASIFLKEPDEYQLAVMDLYGEPGNENKKGIYKRIEEYEKKRNHSNQTLRARVRGATP